MYFRIKAFVLPLMMASVLMISCAEGRHSPTEADLSAFGTYVNALDTPQLKQNMQKLLAGDTARWKADKAVKARYAAIDRYESSPIWFSRLGVSADADSLLAFLRRELPQNGLDTAAFFVPEIRDDLAIVHQLSFDSLGVSINEVLPRLDYHLSKAYARFATGQRYGFISPEPLFNRLNYKPDGSAYARLFDYEIKVADGAEAVKALTSDDRMGFLQASRPDNYVYKALQQRLAQTTDKDERRKLAVNMERCRWQIKHPAQNERRVLVNIPAQHLWAVGGDSVLDMRICCGAVPTKTPLLNSAISYMQVNPEWSIPFNIIKTDVARHGSDSAYFARNRYSIIDRSSGDTLSARTVSADKLRSGQVRVVQKGGAGNSLGRIVFRFPNNFSVYLHDTNNRGAFNRERRTLSHGCVRVQKPFDLACFLLPEADDWLKDRLRISMDMKPVTEQGRSWLESHAEDPRPYKLLTYHDVAPKVPVYIVYYTAYPNPATGAVEQWPDLYSYDSVIAKAMGNLLLK